ncbi:CopD family protein [Polynucleobacter sp. IMCC30063]|uniref:CopD family protein n=1 Tax=unclassified Polynucleobacter TaxID=2640945 RepID=UPI001F477C16|nr:MULTISPECIES: CopD family protein [unclassified Polynucleobacter]MCE7505152.1 CopD family protein [Polynucleobacter sp. IMCC30063]MCE7526056.1 CopD family protein [Polynucleobacter sp. IMCC 30228]MCE7528363.1 CopD family protein [Polynucleobacter sp. IMCC 29146]
MGNAYLWTKTFHIVLITSWFAGLFYLPRIFVNLASEADPKTYERLLGMAGRLYRFMTILMVPAVLLGLLLWLYFGIGMGMTWMHLKIFFVLIILGYHHACGKLLKQFRLGTNTHSHRWYRWFNEAPVILLLVVVALVVIKPL